jgi:hypothetical protein
MSWGAQNRSKDAKTPSAGLAMLIKPEPVSCPVQPYPPSSALRYMYQVSNTKDQGPGPRGFRKKKLVRGPPAPPVPWASPGFLSAERGEGLPSTRNWPFRWPLLPPTSPPHVVPFLEGNMSRQLTGAVVLGGGAAPAPPLAGSGRFCASSIRVA